MRECCACFCAVASKTGIKLPSVFLIKKYSHRSVFFGVSSYILVILNACLFHLLRFFPPYSCHFFLNKETKPFIFLWLQVYSISLVIFSVPATCVSCFLCCLIWIKKNKLLKGKSKSFYFDTRDVFNNPINFWVVNEASRWGHITVEFMPTAYTNLWDWLTRTGINRRKNSLSGFLNLFFAIWWARIFRAAWRWIATGAVTSSTAAVWIVTPWEWQELNIENKVFELLKEMLYQKNLSHHLRNHWS